MGKEKICVEYNFSAISIEVLWNLLSTPHGLSSWFADKVELSGKIYTFTWNNLSQQAEMIIMRTGYYIRFHWLDDDDPKTYFEFRISVDELTGDITLIVMDYASVDERVDTILLWTSQIEELKRKAGI